MSANHNLSRHSTRHARTLKPDMAAIEGLCRKADCRDTTTKPTLLQSRDRHTLSRCAGMKSWQANEGQAEAGEAGVTKYRVALAVIAVQFCIILYLGYAVLDLAVWNDDLKQEVARLHAEQK